MSALLIERTVEHGDAPTPVTIPRTDLQKRRWRAVAEDGTDLAFALPDTKIKHGTLLAAADRVFIVQQPAENIVAVPVPDDPTLAAKIGWYFGNRHIPIEVRPTEILAEDFPTLTDSLTRIGIPFTTREDILHCPPHSEHRH